MGKINPSENILGKGDFPEDRMYAQLAMAFRKNKIPDGPCPSDEQLAAFIDRRLSRTERREVAAHLDACPSCYRQWLDVISLLDAGEAAKYSKSRGWKIGGIVSVAAACLLFLICKSFLFTGNSDLPGLMEKSYGVIRQAGILLQSDEHGLPWELPDTSYGFGSSTRDNPAFRAFGAGLWQGRAQLAPPVQPVMPAFLSPDWPTDGAGPAGRWARTDWDTFYYLGQWCFLLRAVCASEREISPELWGVQTRMAREVKEAFGKATEKTGDRFATVNRELIGIQGILDLSDHESPNMARRKEIAGGVYTIIEELSPKRIPSVQ